MLKNKKKILIAPEYAMSDLAESHKMSSIAKAFLELGHAVYVLGKGRYDYLFDDHRLLIEEIPFDYEWMTDEKFREIHDSDTNGFNFIKKKELAKFVTKEIKLLNRIKPDVVINGFRPTMSISTKVAKIPYVWILSSVLSDMYEDYGLMTVPYGFPKVVHYLLKIMSFKTLTKIVENLYIIPFWYKNWNKIMKKYSLPKYKLMLGLLRGDFNLMCDAPELFPEYEEIPPYYAFCGPLIPEMDIPMPSSLKSYKRKKNRPVIFFSMGSSGDPEIFKKIIKCFEGKPYDVFAATTTILNRNELDNIPENVIVENFFPAIELTKMSDIAIIHGGNGTVYTTIMGGAPFVSIPMFNEQQWNVENVARRGCGIVIPRPKLKVEDVLKAVEEILNNKSYKNNMMELKNKIEKYIKDKNIYPPKIAALKILDFLENKKVSYYDIKGY